MEIKHYLYVGLGIIITAAFLLIADSLQQRVTDPQHAFESFTSSGAKTLAHDDLRDGGATVLMNGGTGVEGENYTLNDDTGVLTVNGTAGGGLDAAKGNISYDYYDGGYGDNSATRTVAGFFTTIMVLGLVFLAVLFIWKKGLL